MLSEMAALNRRRHRRQGEGSVFASRRFFELNERLLHKGLAAGLVRLHRVSAGGKTVGIVGHFHCHGVAYFYQCGFDYSAGSQWSPGTLTLAEVIQRCLDEGCREVSFLAGKAGYKERLSTGSKDLIWAVGRKPVLKEDLLMELHRWKKGALERLRGAGGF
jgi:CelD/BcsL family acetyltransferase involved in cellulose biosynthesis